MERDDALKEILNSEVGTASFQSACSLFKGEKEVEYSLSGYLHTWRAILFQVTLVLMSLSVYTFTPMLINYSVVVRTPSEFSSVVVTLPPISGSKQHVSGLGVDLAHRNGDLFVESQTVDGLAAMAGVLEGDVIAQVWQGSSIIYDKNTRDRTVAEGDSFSMVHPLLSVQRFLENRTAASSLHVDPSLDVHVRFEFYRLEIKTAPAYLQVSVILVARVLGATICIILALFRDPRQLREIRLIMNVSTWKQVAPVCLGNCIAGTCEVYAAGKIPASLYSVLLRLDLLGIATVSYFVLGRRQSPLQVFILLGLTCLVFCYTQVPDIVPADRVWDGFGEPQDPSSPVATTSLSMFGLACVFGKLGGALANNVLGEKVMKGPVLTNESVVVVQGILFVVCSLLFSPFALFIAYGTEWQHGLFGGGDVSFRHCSTDWTSEECARTVSWTLPQGWDIRTIGIVCCYITGDFVLNTVVREFSAIVRSLCGASSVASTYALSVYFLGKSFNVTKCGLILAILLDVTQYAMTPKVNAAEPSKPAITQELSKCALARKPLESSSFESHEAELGRGTR